MKTSLDCIPCFVRQAFEACQMVSLDEEKNLSIMKKVLKELSTVNLQAPPPLIVRRIHRIIREDLACLDPYRDIKDRSIEKAVALASTAEQIIGAASDPFSTALRFSIAGNIIDFGKNIAWDEEKIHASFDAAVHQKIDTDMVELLRKKLANADKTLFIGDNAGESVFDRLFIEQFPGSSKIYYAVKGSPVINDVTEREALASGLDRIATLISTGVDIPGTVLEESTPSFRELFASADLVISKGQGNFETLNDSEREVFFLLQVKCDSLARRNGLETGSWVVTTSTALVKEDYGI